MLVFFLIKIYLILELNCNEVGLIALEPMLPVCSELLRVRRRKIQMYYHLLF